MKSIVLVDDHDKFRQAIREVLEEQTDLIVVGEAANGEQGIEVVVKNKPDILITDLKMPCLDGIGLTEQVSKLCPQTVIIILSQYGDKPYVDAALRVGATGYVLKNCIPDGLIDAVHTVCAGETYLSSTLG